MVSASLDQTVRVWDISGLRKKTVAPGGEDMLRLPQVAYSTASALTTVLMHITWRESLVSHMQTVSQASCAALWTNADVDGISACTCR